MENYFQSLRLLGLDDSNLPVFHETRAKRLASIERINRLTNVAARLRPAAPPFLTYLDWADPEWDDRMVYPSVNYTRLVNKGLYWATLTGFYAYNWNVLHSNLRLRLLAYAYPFISALFLGSLAVEYLGSLQRVRLFENYCQTRARELFEQNRFMFGHDSFRRLMWFHEDLRDTLARVHRQANNHDASDFRDSELLLQDFVHRHSDPRDPDAALFQNGRFKMLN